MNHVTSKWGVLVLLALQDGTHRYSDLRRRIEGVSERMLAQSLKTLEQDGFVRRVAYKVVPPHVEYSLTPLGEGASERIAALAHFLEDALNEQLLQQADRAAEAARA
ncbi:helix-turn-helix domain-containing protein [Phaeobacter sp. HF9A]|uniref:winged helix-turn-helix transcriptional regulator n=1 Tax=Phaeobacter sp. HF9A TaxID=2721561 RepID=UPI0014314EC3|nr:helix-turn-helix domain-containing protein [Phaeobacter sp. HF9A]NIZ12778.1 winged helix-turn-helix transcriptional regulator [Phaeobacter sp. HF9A]